MLLNCFAQPTLPSKGKTYLNLGEFKKAPLLLCNKHNFDGKCLPKEWSGNIYTTQEILNSLEQSDFTIKSTCTQVLCPNKTYNINISSDKSCQYKAKTIELTALPWNKETIIYLIKDDNIVSLLTDIITEDFTLFVQNTILRNSIKNVVDVLYINDGVYHKSTILKEFPSECLLGALVTLVRPRYVKGLTSEEQLPIHVINCCLDNYSE